MKSNNALWTAAICGWFLALAFGYFALDSRWTTQRITLIQQLSDKQNSLLQDQVADMESRMRMNGTYEEGYVAAMIRSGNSEYVEGYHRAVAQLANKDEVEMKKLLPVSMKNSK